MELGHDATAFAVLVGIYAAGSILILAVPRLRRSKVFTAVPVRIGASIIFVEALTLALYLYASFGTSFEASPTFLRMSSVAYGILILWLVAASAQTKLDAVCNGARLGIIMLVVLWIAWSAFFTLAFLHTSAKQRWWAVWHLVHRIVIDGVWTLWVVFKSDRSDASGFRLQL
jgi:hypothetical protein